MKKIQGILVVVGLLACCAIIFLGAVGYVGGPMQQGDTRAQLTRLQEENRPPNDNEIRTHVNRHGAHRQWWGISAVMATVAALVLIALTAMTEKNKPK
ncbi:MAG: hypothetical protein ACKVJX_18065 [Verrucomicrobiia bacterium]|jgi:hypothetical protein